MVVGITFNKICGRNTVIKIKIRGASMSYRIGYLNVNNINITVPVNFWENYEIDGQTDEQRDNAVIL